MNRFPAWLRHTFARSPRHLSRIPEAKLAFEELESRLVPSVTYHGGALLPHVGVNAVYYGPDWQSNPALAQQAQQLDQFLGYIANSPYMDMLGEYGVGRGQYQGNDFNAAGPAEGDAITGDDVVGMLVSEIENGRLPTPDANRLYFVFTPPGASVDGTADSYGYHASAGTDVGTVAYAVVTQGYTNTFDDVTVTATHELAESVTDPGPNGWYDDSLGIQGEIGDLCNGQGGWLHGYLVQKEWSNQYQTGILPFPVNLNTAANGFTHSDEYFNQLIENDYQQVLDRTPAPADLDAWVGALKGGLSDERVLAGFLASDEYFARSGSSDATWVESLYRDVLGRAPDALGESGWLNALNSGHNRTAVLTRSAVAYGFTISLEHERLVIASDYQQILGRTASDVEVDHWVAALRSGSTHENVVAAMAASPEFYYFDSQSFSDVWVTNAYNVFLHRDADNPGFQYWLAILGQGE